MTPPDNWHQHAVNAREALRLLGYPVLMEECLPGESGYIECGQSDGAHFHAYCMTIKATVDHYLSHTTGDRELYGALEEMYKEARLQMDANCRYPLRCRR